MITYCLEALTVLQVTDVLNLNTISHSLVIFLIVLFYLDDFVKMMMMMMMMILKHQTYDYLYELMVLVLRTNQILIGLFSFGYYPVPS